MDQNLITWNVPNWITICLMALTGAMVLGFLGIGLGFVINGSGSPTAGNLAPASSE